MLPQGKKEEIKYSEWYTEHKHRLTSNAYAAKLFIPKHTELMVWYEMWQFNDDFMDYKHMWDKGEPLFRIPSGIVRCDHILSNKDVEVPMTLMSKRNEGDVPDSRIVEELNGGSWPVHKDAEFGDPLSDYDSYGVWVKMYEQPTYIPALGTQIVAYGVFEENLPKVGDCFKYGNYRHGIGGLPYKATTTTGNGIYQPITVDPNLPGQWSGTTTYPTIRPDPLSTKGKSIINQYIQNIQNNPTMKWTCQICGMDTTYVEYDYLGSGTNHLSCELKGVMGNGMSFIQQMEHVKRHIHLGVND